jgi:5-methylcytosine-specific restriction endonuclease McrA
MKILCQHCKTEFNKPMCHVKRVKSHFCSTKCKNLATRNRIEVICKVCNKKFEIRPSEKKKYKSCSKECIRLAKQDEMNPNWKGGTWKNLASERRILMEKLEYKNWRTAVFERDDYTCQFCKKRGGNMEADHIMPWATHSELRYDVTNGRTLCLPCHRTTFGKKQFVREI